MDFQGLLIDGLLVGSALFPTGVVDPHEFETHATHSGVVTFFALAEGLVALLGPAGFSHDMSGVFVEGLATELRTAAAHVNGPALPALLFDRSDAVELLEFLRAGKAFPIRAEGGQQTGGHHRARCRKAAEKLG